MVCDEIILRLTIISENLSPGEIDEYVGIECNDSQIRGEMNRLGTKRYTRHAWYLKSKRVIAPDEYIGDKIDAEVRSLLSRLAPAADKIKELSKSHVVEFSVYFLARDVPPMNFSSEDLRAIAALGASLDIDLILYGSSDSEKV
jgi:hypothetical protein